MDSKSNVCDYKGYDYKSDYWGNDVRKYEDLCEKRTLRTLLKPVVRKDGRLLDAGCGFGRLIPSYHDLVGSVACMDYATNMLDGAKKSSEPYSNTIFSFVQGDFYSIPLKDASQSVVVTVRTIHHVDKPEKFFNEVSRILDKNGHFLIEISNKRHILHIIRWILRKTRVSPFTYERLELGDHFYNYHF